MEENCIFFDTHGELTHGDILSILTLCEDHFPGPTHAYITQFKKVLEIPVTSYLDKSVLKKFNRNKYGIEYSAGYENPGIRITKTDGRGLISIPLKKGDEYHMTKNIALQLVNRLELKSLGVSPVNFVLFKRKYKENRRTTDFPGLYWLQYYDAEEFKKQGGNAILDNPYINAQLIKDGIFIEVGHSPYDFQTPEGEVLMINANAAMPPIVRN
ncbi:hypothetical protein AAEO56_01105 [Flavobacterium sp. DGU11]|uniref:Immunity protein 52 domain-containing protein n=1 Tax=Flavobacterium arundinis TaxID=3139143 RepID=A0ABU9HSZ2_9FLAO